MDTKDFATDNYSTKEREYFTVERREMLRFIPENRSTVLDVGCGDGVFAAIVKKSLGYKTAWGVEFEANSAKIASSKLDKVLTGTIEANLSNLPDGYFDCIVFNDVLEHLIDPYQLLKDIKAKLKPDGVVVSSIPNIRYFRNFFDFVFHKNWDYTDSGIMDFTHFRFFTYKSIRKMYENAGYSIIKHEGINKTKSIRPAIVNLFTLGLFWDIKYLQFATVAGGKK